MPTTKPRANVLIPENIAEALRARIGAKYPDIPGIAEVSLPHLIRFVVVIAAGLPVNEAKKGLHNFTRKGVSFDTPPD